MVTERFEDLGKTVLDRLVSRWEKKVNSPSNRIHYYANNYTWSAIMGARSGRHGGPGGMKGRRRSSRSKSKRRAAGALPAWLALYVVWLAFVGAELIVYAPALSGAFFSDDQFYVAHNPYVHEPSLEHLAAILNPRSPATIGVDNYAPVHLLLHSVAWQLFGENVVGHHVLNLAMHALASLLLVLLLQSSQLPWAAALLGGAVFLLHPANVEAVAWINQLKTTAATVLALGALLAYPRRPGSATLLFGLALLAKAQAVVALPAALLLDWTRGARVRWGWIAAWALVLAVYAGVEFSIHQRSGVAISLHDRPIVLARTICAYAMRYLAMATTGQGLSAFQEPPAAESWLDPWWLAGIACLLLLGLRIRSALLARREESLYWVWAALSFALVSPIFPFQYPMGDRYLYFILPGLLGGALLALRDLPEGWTDAARSWLPGRLRAQPALLVRGLALLLLLGLAGRSHARAEVWSSPETVTADAIHNYPDGVAANLARARRAALIGDAVGAAASLRAASDRGYKRLDQIWGQPSFAAVQRDPRFQAVLREMADWWLDWGARLEAPTQAELRSMALARLVRGEPEKALALLEQALDQGGTHDADLRDTISQIRAQQHAGEGAPP